MTRSQAGTERGRTRRRHRIASITGLVALLGTLLVTVAAPARALTPCADPNFCPVANEDDYQTNFNVKLTVPAATGLLFNDEGPASTHVSTAPGDTDTESWNGAKVTVHTDGSFVYTPDTNPLNAFSGIDSFDYTIVDAAQDFDFNTAYITVTPVVRNDVYGAKTRNVESDLPLIVGDPGVLANDGGIDPDSLVLPTSSQQGGTIDDALDGAFVYTPPLGFNGVDTFQYSGNDLDFDPDVFTGTVTIYVDGTPPVATMSAPGLVTLNTKVPAAWSATDPGGTAASGIGSYDEQYKIALWNGPFGAFTPVKTTVSTTDLIAGTYGRTFCFHVRAKDRAGNYSPFTALRCTAVPLRARSLSYSAKWNRPVNPVYFSGEAFTTIYKGQNAVLNGVQAQRMWLVATKCATCGSVQVRWNNVTIANVSLASPATVRHALVPIATFPVPKLGQLRLYVTSPNGKGVIIEGLAVLRA